MAGAIGEVRVGDGTVYVRGLRELQRAFLALGPEAAAAIKGELWELAEPVAHDAEKLAVSNIRNIGPRWSEMRVGVIRGGAYVAPKSRRRRGSPRRNLAPLLMDRAMQPALDAHTNEIEAGAAAALMVAARHQGFV
jgi:hypothetical protein